MIISDPVDAETYHLLGTLYADQRQFDRAIAAYESSMSLTSGGDGYLWFDLATALAMKADRERARGNGTTRPSRGRRRTYRTTRSSRGCGAKPRPLWALQPIFYRPEPGNAPIAQGFPSSISLELRSPTRVYRA